MNLQLISLESLPTIGDGLYEFALMGDESYPDQGSELFFLCLVYDDGKRFALWGADSKTCLGDWSTSEWNDASLFSCILHANNGHYRCAKCGVKLSGGYKPLVFSRLFCEDCAHLVTRKASPY